MAALSLKMGDPLITPLRARLLLAYWLGVLDEDQVAEMWGCGPERVNEALGLLGKRLYAA